MDFSNIKNKLLICLCVFVVLFPFWLVKGFCTDESNVDYTIVDGLGTRSNTNYFVSADNNKVAYFTIEDNYIFTITNNTSTNTLRIVYCNNTPGVNVPYENITTIGPGESYSFIGDSSKTYCAIGSGNNNINITITKDFVDGQVGAIDKLVNNVGINSIWSIFDVSINYIVIVVLVAFGIFIIFKLIRKLSKGKEGL